jgi:hypothetical protein
LFFSSLQSGGYIAAIEAKIGCICNRSAAGGTRRLWRALGNQVQPVLEAAMRGALLWLVGIPIPIIILLYLFNVI